MVEYDDKFLVHRVFFFSRLYKKLVSLKLNSIIGKGIKVHGKFYDKN